MHCGAVNILCTSNQGDLLIRRERHLSLAVIDLIDEKLEGEIQVTVIATGFESNQPYNNQRARANITTQSPFSRSEAREPGPGIPDFLRLRQNRKNEET